jgi:hypothetical protein
VYLVIDLKVPVQGREKLARLGRPNAFGAASSAMLRRQAEAYKALAVAEAPVGGPYLSGREGGTLKRSHRVRLLNQYAAEVVADAPYARYVAEGTRPHWMPPDILPFPAMRTIALRGTRPNPWLERAFSKGEAQVKGNLDQMAADVVKELGS